MLPASGLTLHVREAAGADELVVLEPDRSPLATVVTLASRLTTDSQGRTPAWEELPAADIGAIALTIRQAWLGERISTDARCPGCLERMDIAFEIPAYLAHHRPQMYPGVVAGPTAGWFELADAPEPLPPPESLLSSGSLPAPESFRSSGALPTSETFRSSGALPPSVSLSVPESSFLTSESPRDSESLPPSDSFEGPASFRLPTIGDLRVALTSADPERCLRERCVRPAVVPAAVASRISRAMTALAPDLTESVTAQCPACGGTEQLRFDPVTYSLAELRAAAAGLYAEIHLLASAFRWPEDAILALPRTRRARYADLIRRDQAAA